MFEKFSGVPQLDRVRNEKVRSRAIMERELTSRVEKIRSESIELVWACGKNG